MLQRPQVCLDDRYELCTTILWFEQRAQLPADTYAAAQAVKEKGC